MADQTTDNLHGLIENSSFGTAAAQQLRRRTSPEAARQLARRMAASASDDQHPTRGEPSSWLNDADLQSLVIAAQAGDSNATTALFTRIQPVVLRYCRARIQPSTSTRTAAEDVAQDACLSVLGALKGFDGNPRSFLSLVYGIASHKVADHYRKSVRNLTSPTQDAADATTSAAEPEQESLRSDLRAKMQQLMDELTPHQREVLRLRLIVGLSAAETAAAVGVTETAVRVTHHRALNKLRELALSLEPSR